MRRIFPILLIGLVAGLAYIWFVAGPSILIGGPHKAAIVDATRAALAGPPGTTTEADVAAFTPKGLCNKGEDGSFACIVEKTLGGQTDSAVVVLRKDASGKWVAVE